MEVTSEIYSETDFGSVKSINGNVISKFKFNMPGGGQSTSQNGVQKDQDDDLIVPRKKNEFIEIEHKKSTILGEVGLQVWRGALLLNDFILENRDIFANKTILEVGSGVGISSIVASIYAKKVICTDINIGGILDLIKRNLELNRVFQRNRNNIEILELNFLDENYSVNLEESLKHVDIAICADVIYDNAITNGFIQTIIKLFKKYPLKSFFVALEKRFVFTDSVCAPMYEYFLENFTFKTEGLKLNEVSTTFPQYFEYDRCKELILLEVTRV